MNTLVELTGNSFVMPDFDVTAAATFVDGSLTNGDYVKVTSALDDWSGEYLIVYETGKKAFNGGLTTLDATGNYISVTISNATIEATNTTNAAKFNIASYNGGYSIQSASGYYIGRTSNSNGLNVNSSTPLKNTISYSNNSVNITSSGGPKLQFYNQSNNSHVAALLNDVVHTRCGSQCCQHCS